MANKKQTIKSKQPNKNDRKVIQLTNQGLEELKEELRQLVEEKIPEVIKRVAVARAHGDLSENAEYQNAREEQQLLEARQAEIENVIAHAQVVKNTTSSTTVGMGSTVKVSIKGKKDKTFTYTIVGEFEADPAEGKVSSDSPIGRGLMGKKKGDSVEIEVPAGSTTYIIEDVK